MNKSSEPFWHHKTLDQLTREEWELLCDGCARCCLHKLEDEDTGIVYFTNVACRLLDADNCRCRDYPRRKVLIRDCVMLTPDAPEILQHMPPGCAYRLVAEGKPLYWWHHLISGSRETVHTAGISVRGRTVKEEEVEDYEEQIVDWPLEYD
jgi:uncharacterized cysteine cluster protein YcgN (CxxCxxCC family)